VQQERIETNRCFALQSWVGGWRLPRHRTRLCRLPQSEQILGEKTAMLALFEADDEASAIVAALGYFVWRQEPRWCECACGCGTTFIKTGKRTYLPGH
jgi:hypothetical protein